MAANQRKPSIQPRATKASMLRLQKQQQSGSGAGLVTAEEPVTEHRPSSSLSSKPSRVKDGASASAGVKAFMAQQRARISQADKTPASPKEPIKKRSTFMTGAQRYSDSSDATSASDEKRNSGRSLKIVIKQAKSSGKLNISSRDLTQIPEEILKMYHVDPNSVVVDFTSSGDAWYDSVELTKFIASDNAIIEIDSRIADEFGALKTLDFRANKLTTLPESLSKLQNLTSILMPYNNFTSVPDVLNHLHQLKELNLSHNQIKGSVTLRTTAIEALDLSYNEIEVLEIEEDNISNLTKLNISFNHIAQLPSVMNWPRLQELQVNQNKLKTLFPVTDREVKLPVIVRLDAGNNRIEKLYDNVSLPKLIELSLMTNKLQDDGLSGLSNAPQLQTLDLSSNQLQNVPTIVSDLTQLQRLDVRGNQLHALPYELGKLEHLKTIHCENNPMRAFSSMSQTQLIASLKSSFQQQQEEEQGQAPQVTGEQQELLGEMEEKDDIADLSGNFTQKVSLTKKLDLSRQQLSELPSTSMHFTDDIPGTIQLDYNEFTMFPSSLTIISSFIVHLNLEHNRLTSFSFTMSDAVFPNLKILKLSNNRIKSIECIQGSVSSFPKLEELSMGHNSLTVLPENMPAVLPCLRTFAVNSNKLDNITDQMFGQTLEILDLSNNDIGYLPPGLSALQNLQELVVFGNRFRVPRPAVVEQGTKAVLEFLKRRHNAN